jgi:outer membrane protein assembly factor BamD
MPALSPDLNRIFHPFLLLVLFLNATLQAAPEAPLPSATDFAAAQTAAASGKTEEAIRAYHKLVKNYPFSNNASEAQFQVAQLLQKQDDFDGSFKEYTKLLNKYPETPHFEQAVAEEVIIANAYLKGRRVKIFGIPAYTSMEKAEEMYEAILSAAPYSKYAPLVQFNLGLTFERQGKGTEAAAAYQKLIDKYPNSSLSNTALYQIGYVYMRVGMAGRSQDLSALKEAQESFQDFSVQYPNDEKSFQAEDNMKAMLNRESQDTMRIARFYDFSKDYQASAIYYHEVMRKFGQSSEASDAKTRLAELKDLVGEDALRSGQRRALSGKEIAFRRKLEAQVETIQLSNYDGPAKDLVKEGELQMRAPDMKSDVQEIPLSSAKP